MTTEKGKYRIADEIIDLATFDLSVVNVDKQISTAASTISRAGELWGAAQEEADIIDAEYRQWRGEYAKKLLEKDPKMAEHKIKAEIESHETFLKLKKAIALAKKNALVMKSLVGSLEIRASLLQTKGANKRAELEKTGIVTREHLTEPTRAGRDIAGIVGKKGPARPRPDDDDDGDADGGDVDDD